ncbi:hypothetical protein Gotri_007884, partial [Gossypium trilobum]|nr:hypothetical protein [Gossypium trilobum]
YLDENKKLILAILDNQNLGKLAECAHGTRIESYLDPNWDECSADMSEPCDAYTDGKISTPTKPDLVLVAIYLASIAFIALMNDHYIIYHLDTLAWFFCKCAIKDSYQAQLQKNLMYLAAIADAQPQSMPTMPPQMAPHPAIPTGGYFMQHPQAAAMAQQPGMYPQKVPLQFNNPHQMQDPQHLLHQQHQQAMQGQMGIRPGGPNNGMHPMHSEASLGGGSSAGPPQSSGPSDGRAGNKQNPETGANGQGSTTGDRAEEGK